MNEKYFVNLLNLTRLNYLTKKIFNYHNLTKDDELLEEKYLICYSESDRKNLKIYFSFLLLEVLSVLASLEEKEKEPDNGKSS